MRHQAGRERVTEFQIWDGPRTLTINGETRTVAAWARLSGVNYNTLYYRLKKGVEPATAVFSKRYATELRIEGADPLPVFKPRRVRRTPVRFDVGQLPRWGSVQSLTFRRAA